MSKSKLKDIDGKKIRRQYFTFPIILLSILAIMVPYAILVFSIQLDKFDVQEWVSSIWISIWLCFCFSIPFIILNILNKRYFGKIVCVLTEDGIHHENGFVEWNDITEIEYEINIRSRAAYNPLYDVCHAVIYTAKEKIHLFHSPLFFLSTSKKYNAEIVTRISKKSKWFLKFIGIVVILMPFIVILMKL